MDFILSNLSLITWIVLGACVALAVYPLTRSNKLAAQIPGPPGGKWTTGHFRSLFGLDGVAFQENLVSNYGATVKLKGSFGEEFIYTVDPAIMHAVLVKDRANFQRPEGMRLIVRYCFGGGLLGQSGEEHRLHRKILTPVFTMQFLRELMPIFMGIAQETCKGIEKDLATTNNPKEIDIYPWMTSAALELIGEAGLGYSFDSFTGQRNRYKLAMRDVERLVSKSGPFLRFLPYIYNLGTPTLRQWVLRYNPIKIVRLFAKAVKIQNEQTNEVLRIRQELIDSGVDLSSETGRGRDLMTLLMKANKAEGTENHIDRQAMIGHMNILTFAGHETTSTAITRILDVLAQNQEVQTKLREELNVHFKKHPDSSDQNDLLELPYLDAVIRESLRMYGPATGITRTSSEDTVLQLEYPIDTPNGKITSIPIKKGTRIMMSILMANRYEKIWGETSHEFWPERWIGNRRDEVTEPGVHLPGVYSSMMTFGGGPTSCIGFKFAVMETKVIIAALVHKFKFEPSDQKIVWAALMIQLPVLKKEQADPGRLPKLPLKVTEIKSS